MTTLPNRHRALIGLPDDIAPKLLRPLDGLEPGFLRVHEIYASIQGESTHAGRPCTFIRTTACHLRCTYCDTPHAFAHGETLSIDEVLGRVRALSPRLVELTGGEPLLQPEAIPLMTALCDEGYEVLLETSGTLDIRAVDPRVVKIVDLKTPSSGELERNRYDNLEVLSPRDEIKFVIGSRADYEWARSCVRERLLAERCTVLFSTVHGSLAAADVVAWILEDALPVRFQLQMHKVIWDPKARGV